MSFTLQQYCENGDIDGVNDRLEEGEDPDEYDENGMTALCIAAAAGNTEIVEILIDANADSMLTDKNTGRHPLHWACTKGIIDVFKCLLEKGSNPYKENLVELPDPDGMTPLMVAASSGSTDLTIYLREEMKSIINAKSKIGKTALHYAAEKGHEGPTVALLSRGAYSHIADDNGDQALVLASRNRYMELALLMCQKGCYSKCSHIDKALNRTSVVIKDKTKVFKRTKPKEDKKAKRRAARNKKAT